MSENDPLSPSRNSDLEWQVAALQRQVFLLLVGLIVVCATLGFYLFCESSFMSRDLTEIQPQATQIIKTYNLNASAINNFRMQLVNYGAAHPNFQPILRKYGLQPAATMPGQ